MITFALVANYVIVALVVLTILRRREEPAAMLGWLLFVTTAPFIGWITYLIFGSRRVRRRAIRRQWSSAGARVRFERHAQQATRGWSQSALPKDLRQVAQVGRRVASAAPVGGNHVDVFIEAEETFTALEQAIRAAEHHIHAEYYIWNDDETGRAFRDLLIERVKAGVEVRVLLDSVGCWRLPRGFWRPLLEEGGEVAWFLPLWNWPLRWNLHLRNHRKLVVIDGREAFLGSQNIGDEYRGRLKRLSPWYDAHMRVVGPAAGRVQQVFAEDWQFATGRGLPREKYFPTPPMAGNCVVQILPTGPDEAPDALSQMSFAAVTDATERVRLATPYFVPPPAVRIALTHAAHRGVRVQLVLPTRSDHPVVLWAGRSFYAELLSAGVEIYEFGAGMLHSKLVTVDDRWFLLGSANMDIRSFKLNYELTAVVYHSEQTRELADAIDDYIARSEPITRQVAKKRGLIGELAEGAARLMSPVL
ncbi:MAG: cardiolipin synthase [Phycisphaerales bacterium]|nr:cardiolipin synthase [Phycisphaerales bacterium]